MGLSLFRSKREIRATKQREMRINLSRGRRAIGEHIRRTDNLSRRYRAMARDALELKQSAQSKAYVASHLRFEGESRRWKSFLLTLEDLEHQGTAMAAISDLMLATEGLVAAMSPDHSPHEIARLGQRVEKSVAQVDRAKEEIADMMEATDLSARSSSLEETPCEDDLSDETVNLVTRALTQEIEVKAIANDANESVDARLASQDRALKELQSASPRRHE